MALSYSTSARNAATDAINALVNGGTLELQAGASVLATFTLGSPAFGSASSGSSTLNSVSNTTATAAGTVDSFEIKDSGGNVEMSGTVTGTGGGGDIEIDDTTLVVNQVVSVSSITHQAIA